jgi:hypothetical protein
MAVAPVDAKARGHVAGAQRRIAMKGTWMAAGVLAVAGMAALPAESRADTRVGIGIFLGRDSRYGRPDTFRLGYDRGYREGTEHGYKDGRKGRSSGFWHSGDYRDADEGYKGWMGPRGWLPPGLRGGLPALLRGRTR